jgi:hypothetical protein
VGMYTKKKKSAMWRDTCIPTFSEELFIRGKVWTQPKCLSMDKCMQEIRCKIYVYNGVLSHKRKPFHLK